MAVKKKTVLLIVIPIVLIFVLGVCILGGFLVVKYFGKAKGEEIAKVKEFATDWAESFYNYLKGEVTASDENSALPKELENAKLKFIQLGENQIPVMILKYFDKSKNQDVVRAHYINDEGNIGFTGYYGDTNTEELDTILLYNREEKEYKWYAETVEKDGKHKYTDIEADVNELKYTAKHSQEEKYYESEEYKELSKKKEPIVFEKDEMSSGDNDEVSKFEETFISPEATNKSEEISIENIKDLDKLKENINNAANGYKEEKEVVTQEVTTRVEKEEEAIKEREEKIKREEEEKKKQEEEAKITSKNVQSKIGEHLKWAAVVYLGSDYGLPTVYKMTDQTGKVTIPGVDNSFMMCYEVVGLKSIQSLKDKVSTYMTSSAISKLGKSMWGEYTKGLKEYKGKVYLCRGGIGDGPSINTKKAKVLSSEKGVTKVQLSDINVLGDVLEATITLTVKYDVETQKYIITDASIKQ